MPQIILWLGKKVTPEDENLLRRDTELPPDTREMKAPSVGLPQNALDVQFDPPEGSYVSFAAIHVYLLARG